MEPPTWQSTIYEQIIGGNDMEALAKFPANSFERQLAAPVGSIAFSVEDRPGEVGFCTGVLISERMALTNRHCFISGASKADLMVFRLGMLEAGMEHRVDEYLLQLPPLEIGTDYLSDYAIFKLDRAADKKWGSVQIAIDLPEENQGLLIVQHPKGLPQLITKGRCAAASNKAIRNNGKRLFHECDTDGGSSGSPSFFTSF